MKIVILIIVLLILASLGSALFYLARSNGSHNLVKSLTVRIALSIGLFILLIAAFYFGLITPHGL